MAKSTTFSAPFLRYSLPPETKILCPRIYLRVKKTVIDNQFYLHSRTDAYGSYMIEGVGFNVSYTALSGIRFLCIIIFVASAEGLSRFLFDTPSVFQNRKH